jgi:hypothetical protein
MNDEKESVNQILEEKRDQKFNIYDIKGIGKEIREGIDAQEYVNKERASWRIKNYCHVTHKMT